MKVAPLLLLVCALLVGAAQGSDRKPVEDELRQLQGSWISTFVEYGPEKHRIEHRIQTWQIDGNLLTRYTDGKKVEVVRIELQPDHDPKQLDLVPSGKPSPDDRDILQAPTKLIYAIEKDRLRVGWTYDFLPMQPEQERQQAIRWAGIRPKSFETKNGGVMVITLERSKDPLR